MLSSIAAFAEEELRSMSANQKWTIQKRYKEGITNAQDMMGYYKNECGELVINEKQAKIVRRIYDMYISGDSTDKIAKKLNEENIPTYKNRKWSSGIVGQILKNEKYKGDCKLQKFYCPQPNRKSEIMVKYRAITLKMTTSQLLQGKLGIRFSRLWLIGKQNAVLEQTAQRNIRTVIHYRDCLYVLTAVQL